MKVISIIPLAFRNTLLQVSLLFLIVSFSVGLVFPVTAKELSPNQIKKIQQRFDSESNSEIRTKLYILLIRDAAAYKNRADEIRYRLQLLNELKGKIELVETHFANLYQTAVLEYKEKRLPESLQHFEELLGILPIANSRLRNLTLQHLSKIARMMERPDLEEKYLALYVVAMGKTANFYETTGGYEQLLQLSDKTGSKKSHYYFENWFNSAQSNGTKEDQKQVLTLWVNFATQDKANFSDKPFEQLSLYLAEVKAINELQDLRLLYAQSTTDEQKQLALYEEIRQENDKQGTQTNLGLLTRLYKAYQTAGETKKEQAILEILSERNDYQGRQEALKQLALLSLKNEDWILSLQSHQKMMETMSLESSKEAIVILDNLISIAQKLANDDLTVHFLKQKALTPSKLVEDAARYKAFVLAMDLHKKNQELDAAIGLYRRMVNVSFQANPFPRKYEIHFHGALAAEEKGDLKSAIAFYQRSLETITTGQNPNLEQGIKIAEKILLLTESHSPGAPEIEVLKQIADLHLKLNKPKDMAKTELIIAQKLEKSGNKNDAINFYNASLDNFKKANDTEMVKQLNTLLLNLEDGLTGKRLNRLLELEKTQQSTDNKVELIATRFEIGNYHKAQADSNKAVEFYLKAANSDAEEKTLQVVEAGYFAGLLITQSGNVDRSNQVFQQALAHKGKISGGEELFSQIHQAYSKNLNSQSNIAKAIEQIDIALGLKVAKMESALIHTKATILINGKQYKVAEAALSAYLKTVQQDKDKVPFLVLLAKAQLGYKNFKSALETLEQALEIHGKSEFTMNLYDVLSLKSFALSLKGDLIETIKNQESLIDVIERLAESDQKSQLGPANLQLVEYHLQIGRLSDALRANKAADFWMKKQPEDQLRILLNYAKIAQKQSNLKESEDYFVQLQQLIKPDSSRELVAEMYYQRGFTRLFASKFAEALGDFQSAEKSYRDLVQPDKVIQSQMAQANVLMNSGRMEDAEKLFLKLLTEQKDNRAVIGDVNNSLAFLNSELGRNAKALEYSQSAESAYKKANQQNRTPEVMNARGLIFLKMNDFEQAEVTFINATKLNAKFNNPLLDSEISNNLGGLYKSKGDLEKARNQLMKTAELQKKLGFESLLALTFNNIGSVYLEEKKYDEALQFLRQSRSFSEKYNLKKDLAISWNNEGFLFFKQDKFDDAEKAFNEAVVLQRELELRIDLARTLNNLSIIASSRKDLKKALDLVQEAVESLSLEELDKEQFFPNPEKKSILAPGLMKDFLQNKGAILRELGDQTEEKELKVKYLEASYKSLALSIDLIESLRAQIKGEESQQMLMQTNINIFQQLIAILYELGNRAPGKGFHEKAFFYGEMSRARSFLDQLQEQVAKTAAQLPKEVREKEEILKNQIATLDKNIFIELTKPQSDRDEKKIEEWQIQKTEVQLAYREFTKELEEKFPAFANLKYPKVYDVAIVQKELLDEKTQILGYFLGEDVSYGWRISKASFAMIELPPNADIDHLVRKYRKTLVNPLVHEDPEDDEMIIDSSQSHIVIGLQIFRKVLEPLLKDSPESITQLMLVPDGVLYYLPFETTVVQIHPQDDKRFPKGREYMLHRYSIHYTPSVSVLGMIYAQVKSRDVAVMAARKTFVGFGDPEYKPDKENEDDFEYNKTLKQQGFYDLDRLINSKKELEQISSNFPDSNTVFLRENAKESAVKFSLSDVRYIHFATHGILDERNPEFSGVIMNLVQPDKPEDGFLQASEIFDLKLNADLVVLSACETGLGKVIKGEGMVGLTRSFLFAGTSSIVVSLWTVADESTSKLMIYLYKFLGEGLPKDEALRKARLTLMNEKEEEEFLFPDPFFWGPFILNGTRI